MKKMLTIWLAVILLFSGLGTALAAEAEEEVNNGQDITRPLTRFDLRYQYENTPVPGGENDDAHIITLRMDRPFDIAPQWKLALRFDLPLMITDKISDDNRAGNFHFGLSDVLAQALLVNVYNERFAWAAGAQIVLPTATEDEMGTGKYRVVPTVGLRWTTPELLKGSWIALAARWDRSFAESRSDSVTVNELQFAPVINIPLPNYWFIDLFPSTDIRYNLGDKKANDSGRLFLPANVLVGKMLAKDIVATLEVGVPIIDDYEVYDFKIEARVGFFF